MKHTDRRQFLIGSMSSLGAAWLAAHWPAMAAAEAYAQSAAKSQRFQFFSPEQAAEVEAMAAQIIPADDTPGAREAHVIYFIDRVLTTFESEKQPLYKQGLPELQAKVRELFPGAQRFADLTSAQQVQLLTAMEKSDFFEVVRLHTIMGFFANEEYGGNHGQVGWKLIGFEDVGSYQPPFGYYDAEAARERMPKADSSGAKSPLGMTSRNDKSESRFLGD